MMKIFTTHLKQTLALLLLSTVFISFNQAMAQSDMEMKKNDHSKHQEHRDKKQEFHGVYYGFVPCKDCPGLKMTLSLKNKMNYLIVTQNPKASAREFYEKGKYNWDDESAMVTLVSRKDSSIRKFRINDDDTLLMLSAEGEKMKGEQKRYILRKRAQKQPNQIHLH